MAQTRAQDRDEEDLSEAERQADRPKGSSWISTFLGGVASVLIPIVMSLGLIRQLQESITLEMILSIGVLVALVVLLFALSFRQRYNERAYLRAWKERQERQLALKHKRQAEAFDRNARESRQDIQSELEPDDEQAASIEIRLLRSAGLEQPS